MPFTSTARLKIDILSEAGMLSFKESKSNIVTYSLEDDSQKKFKIVGAQRIGTGEALDPRVWHLNEIKQAWLTKHASGLRCFELIFEGTEYTDRFRKLERASGPVLDLYRSITCQDKIRLLVSIGDEALPTVLEVQLSYRLEQVFGSAACGN